MKDWFLAALAFGIIAVTFVYFFVQEVAAWLWSHR
jgi:hypothetical protein